MLGGGRGERERERGQNQGFEEEWRFLGENFSPLYSCRDLILEVQGGKEND